MPHLKLNSQIIYYALHRGNGPHHVLLLHGAGGDHTHWPNQLRQLSGAHVYAIDLPGHGKSTGDPLLTIEAFSEVINQFVCHLRLTDVVLLGHSMGGGIALNTALNKPHWLKKLILVGSGAKLRVNPQIFTVIQSNFASAADRITQFLYHPKTSKDLIQKGRELLIKQNPATLYCDFKACDAFNVMDRLNEIDKPTLIIVGQDDVMTPVKYSEYLNQQIKNSHLKIIDEAGHMVALEKPEELVNSINDFMVIG